LKSLLKRIPTFLNVFILLQIPGILVSQTEINTYEIDSLNESVWQYVNKNIERFRSISFEALGKSNEVKYLKGKCFSLQNVGTYYYLVNNQDSSLHYYNQALIQRRIFGDSSLISGTINNIANVLEKQGKYYKAETRYLEALSFLNNPNSEKTARLYNNISAVNLRMGNFESALEYNLRASKLLGISSDTLAFSKCLLNRGSIYESILSHDKAIEFYDQSLSLFTTIQDDRHIAKANNNLGNAYLKRGNFSKAVEHFKIAYNKFTELESTTGQAASEQNLALAYKFMGEYEESHQLLKKSLSKWKVTKNKQKLAEIYLELGTLSLRQNRVQESLDFYESSLELLNFNSKIKFDLFTGLARVNERLGKLDNATKYYVQCLAHKDSLSHEQMKWNNLERLNLENENRIELLKKDHQIEAEQNRKERLIKWLLAVGLLVVSLLFFTYYKYVQSVKRKTQTELKLKEKQIQIESLLKDQELISIRRILEIQELERQRIAQDLHDRLGSMLSMVKIHFSNTNTELDRLKDSNKNTLNIASSLIDEACEEVRIIAHNLASGVLKNFGLVAAVQDMKKTLDGTGHFKTEFVTHNMNSRLPSDIEVMFFRIIQELVANIVKHAGATEISIQLLHKNETLFLEVSDNGKGFINELEKFNNGLGFKNIRSRIYPLKGNLTIDSQLETGTSVFVEVPIKKEE